MKPTKAIKIDNDIRYDYFHLRLFYTISFKKQKPQFYLP